MFLCLDIAVELHYCSSDLIHQSDSCLAIEVESVQDLNMAVAHLVALDSFLQSSLQHFASEIEDFSDSEASYTSYQ